MNVSQPGLPPGNWDLDWFGRAAWARPLTLESPQRRIFMEGPARGCLAGLISWKLGGGVISTIVIFLIVFWLLGYVHC